jgi:cytochrome c oxidase subunit 2
VKRLSGLLGLLVLTACAGSPIPARVVAPVQTAVVDAPTIAATPDAIEHGRALFRNKGCVTCHVNERVAGESGVMNFGAPNLTRYSNDPEFLRRWLTNPSAVRPGTRMPNLRLGTDEIEDLIAFLNAGSQ